MASLAYFTSSNFLDSNCFILSNLGKSSSIFFFNIEISFFCFSFSFSSISSIGLFFLISNSFSLISFFNISICESSYPNFFSIVSLKFFRTIFIFSEEISSLSIPITALINSLNSFGFAFMMEFNSPCLTIEAIFSFSKSNPINSSIFLVIDSPNCFLSPSAIGIHPSSVFCKNWDDNVP